MVKCITAIYCQLAEPPLFNYGLPTSRISFSSMSEFPPQYQHDRVPQYRRSSSYKKWFSNPFHTDSSKELSGSYSAMVEIQGLCLDASRLTGVENILQNFRLVLQSQSHYITTYTLHQISIFNSSFHMPLEWFCTIILQKSIQLSYAFKTNVLDALCTSMFQNLYSKANFA